MWGQPPPAVRRAQLVRGHLALRQLAHERPHLTTRCGGESGPRPIPRDLMNRIVSAILFAIAISDFGHADCQPGKDHRSATKKSGGLGVEVVVVNLSGAATVDSAEVTRINDEMIGACFDNTQTLDDELYSLFRTSGYVSVYIQNLQAESVNPEVTPTPVQVTGNIIEGQKCPTDVTGLYQFLLDHRSNSLEADPRCVDAAFSAMSFRSRFKHSRFYTNALIQLLEFERNIDQDFKMTTLMSQYPATEHLDSPPYIPYLVNAIKESDSELARTNAAYTVRFIYGSCVQAAVSRLNREAEKPGTTSEQRTRLQIAAEYIRDYLPGVPGQCKSPNGEPATEEEIQKELDGQTGIAR
jgi:hypothetical protein